MLGPTRFSSVLKECKR
jgi:Copine